MTEVSSVPFIYVLIDPRTQETRYVGKAVNPYERLKSHIREASRPNFSPTYKNNWIRQLLDLSLRPILQIIEEVTVEQIDDRERYWIRSLRMTSDLTNATDGGEGGDVLRRMSPERRQQRAEKIALGVQRVSRTQQYRKNLSDAALRRPNISQHMKYLRRLQIELAQGKLPVKGRVK